jgi:cytochrome P450
MASTIDGDFDPTAREGFDDAHREFARLRRECPVARAEALGGFWALTRYDDVEAAAADPATFTTTVQNVVPKVAFTGRRPPLHLDPPEHTPYRRALNPLLSRERVRALEPTARRIARDLMAPMVARGGGNISTDFASHFPVHIVGEWMRMPPEWLGVLHDAGRAFILAVHSDQPEAMKSTSLALYDMAKALISLRRREPQDAAIDPTSALLCAAVDGVPLPEDLVVGTVRQVLVVGMVAPMVLIGSIAVHLARDPELQSRLRADPALIPSAVEEFLRLYSPYRGFARTPRHDVVIRGREIARHDPVALVYASANRDEDVFAEPDRFVIDRPNIERHLAFGRGPHSCPGLHLGRMELCVALEELLDATCSFELAGEIVMTRWPEIGALSVPLRLGRPGEPRGDGGKRDDRVATHNFHV